MFLQKKIIGHCFFISHIVDRKLPWRHQFKKIRRGVYSVEKCIIVCYATQREPPSSLVGFLEMVGRKPQAGKRVRRGKEKGVYVERCIFGSSGSWLRANLLQIAPSPNAYPQKGPKFGFFCITYSHLGECARKYYNILSRAVFTWISRELLYS